MGRELHQLRTYKEKLERFHQIDPESLGEEEQTDQLEDLPFLRGMLEKDERAPAHTEREIHHVSLYLHFFEKDFLAILSETRLKLDFKHSLERESFYHRFESLRRRLEDLRG